MKFLCALLFPLVGVAAQQEPPRPAGQGAAPGATPAGRPASLNPIQYDANGYPVLPDGPALGARTFGAGRPAATATPPPAPAGEAARPAAADAGTRGPARSVGSGMEFDSPLLDVFQYVKAPGAWKALGGRTLWWRVTVYGVQGEIIGRRELTHVVDCAFAERDRLEWENGRIYGRSAQAVFAEQNGMPWPTLAEAAGHELALFGLHARLPWCFHDAVAYAVLQRDTAQREGEALTRVVLERRPGAAAELIGPDPDPRPRDRFEILYEPTTGRPREFVHRFANSLETRRVLLEDWQDVDGVRMPFRRVYVDADGRQTTMLEVLRVEPARVAERTFRLH